MQNSDLDLGSETLVIQLLRYIIECDKIMKEEMKVILREIKKNLQGTNSKGKEAGIQINDLKHKEEINIQPEQKKETKIQKKKNEERLRNLWDISKCANT